jgi:ribosomal protein L31E
LIWKRGIKKPKTKIKIKAVKEGEVYKVDLAS